jgi:hypothetical protein
VVVAVDKQEAAVAVVDSLEVIVDNQQVSV